MITSRAVVVALSGVSLLVACPGSFTSEIESSDTFVQQHQATPILNGEPDKFWQSSVRTDRHATEEPAATVIALNDALRRLTDPSSNYRAILQDTLSTLSRAADNSAAGALSAFLTRAPMPGPEFKCDVAFIRQRARQELLRIKDTVLGKSPQPSEPEFCYAAPYAIDLSKLAQGRSVLEIYGYDFDRAPVEMFLVNSDGYEDVTFALVKRTHYHLTLNLGNNGVVFSSKSRTLGLTWGNLVHQAIGLIQPGIALCASRVLEIPAGKTITYALPLESGARGIMLSGVSVWASATLVYSSNELDATVCMTATEKGGTRSALGGCTVEFLATIDPDRTIERVVGAVGSQVFYTHRNRLVDVKIRGEGPVRQWVLGGLGASNPNRPEVTVSVSFKGISVVSTEADGCISPISYLEAKRTNSVSAVTARDLDRQLTRTSPSILRLRPSFAPPTL